MSTLQGIAYTDILERPLLFYLGILTYLLLVSTALLNVLRARVKRMHRLPIKVHRRLAYITLGFATLPGLLSLSIYL